MEIKKLEKRVQWLCNVNGHSYVRTEIDWTNKEISINWHVNEDQIEGEIYLNDNDLEKLFWENNTKKNNPMFYDSNTDKYFTPDEKGWWVQYKTESGDSGALKIPREPLNNEDALLMLKEILPDELWEVQFYNEIN